MDGWKDGWMDGWTDLSALVSRARLTRILCESTSRSNSSLMSNIRSNNSVRLAWQPGVFPPLRQYGRDHDGPGLSVSCHRWGPSPPASDPRAPEGPSFLACQSPATVGVLLRQLQTLERLKGLPSWLVSLLPPLGSFSASFRPSSA